MRDLINRAAIGAVTLALLALTLGVVLWIALGTLGMPVVD